MRPADTPFIHKTRALGRDRDTDFGAEAFRLCKGFGLEIGAVNCPFDVDAEVAYLDQVPLSVLLERHKDDPNVTDAIPLTFVAPSIPYSFLADGALDFVIASHVLEHVACPGAALREFARVVKPSGIVYCVVPHKDYCFDAHRPVTSLKHLAAEFLADIHEISFDHYLDTYFDGIDIAAVAPEDAKSLVARARISHAGQLDFHVHTFTDSSFFEFLDWLAPRIGVFVEHRHWNGLHIHAALRKL
jgi:SAM-dependent methyltransferase